MRGPSHICVRDSSSLGDVTRCTLAQWGGVEKAHMATAMLRSLGAYAEIGQHFAGIYYGDVGGADTQ